MKVSFPILRFKEQVEMISAIVNTVSVILGSIIGLILKKGLPEKLSTALFTGLGLCTLYIGISGSLKGENVLIAIISIAIGAIIGTLLDLDEKLNNLGKWIENKFNNSDKNNVSIAQGFVTASLLFCTGAMTIVGSLQSGLTGNHDMIFAKSLLDFIAAIVLTSSMGIGVAFASVFVLIYQGAIVLFAQFLEPFLTQTVINEMTCTGSLLIIALGLNMLKVTDIKVMNYIIAIFIPIILCIFM